MMQSTFTYSVYDYTLSYLLRILILRITKNENFFVVNVDCISKFNYYYSCWLKLECLVQCFQIHRHVSSMSNIFWVSLNLSGFLHLFESQVEKYNGMTSTHFQTIRDTLSHTLHILFLQFPGLSKLLGMLVLCLPGLLCDVEPKFAAT